MQNCHSIIVTGKVQDMGFRSIVEHIGRSFGIPGLVFNARDGSVKILCSGEDTVVDNFTQTIRMRGEENGTEIASINEKTLAINIDLPDEFSKVSSDDEIDIGRKLDKGNLLLATMIIDNKTGFNDIKTGLGDIKTDLGDIKTGLGDIKTGLGDIKTGLNNLTTMMYEHNTRLEAHNTRLEAILEKLVNK